MSTAVYRRHIVLRPHYTVWWYKFKTEKKKRTRFKSLCYSSFT